MSTRRQFIQSLPAAGAAYAVAGRMIFDESPAMALGTTPPKGHFHPKGKAPSPHTLEVLRKASADLPFGDKRDFAEQKKGLIAPMKEFKILADAGHVAWDMQRFQFLEKQEDFDSIHPSLLRQARLNNNYGLYEVTEGIYQVRGFDLSNITFVRGKTGWIVFDPLITAEPVRAAWKLFQEHVGEGLPVSAVIYSHTHGDHWGGVRGIVKEEDVRSGKVALIAPAGFMDHTISENVYAGNAMNRRLFYQYGLLLPASPYGFVDMALGKGVSAGATGLIAPNRYVAEPIEEFEVDGVMMVFQNTPNTEAPREMNTYIPELKALWTAENVTATLHNIYTLRGAPVRDPLNWSKYIADALYRFGLEAEVLFASHHWPRWGNARVQEVLRAQRDLYANMNNQVLHLANQGVTIREVHNVYEMPKSLLNQWHCRGYHGSPENNSRGVIQRFLGYWDGNPANLIPAPQRESAALFVEMMGGASEDPRPGPGTPRPGQIPSRPGDSQQAHPGRTAEPGRQGSAGGRVRADRLPAGERGPAKQFPRRCLRTPVGNSARRSGRFKQPRRDPRDVDGVVPELPRHPYGQPQGRGNAIHDQPHHARQRREVPDRAGKRNPDEHPRVPR